MSRLDDLITELCPDGVEFKELNELGIFFNGLTGKAKGDFGNGNAKYITYKNIFNNIAIKSNDLENVLIKENEKQNSVLQGDVLFTTSSEIWEESGMSSVVTQNYRENVYLNSFSFGFRFNNNDIIPGFAKYLFRSDKVRKQILKTSNGVTRYNISKSLMKKIKIPVPPLPVQEEIVRILDRFTELEARTNSTNIIGTSYSPFMRKRRLKMDNTFPITEMTGGIILAKYEKKPRDTTHYQTEQQLETKFMTDLVHQGYEEISLTSHEELLANVRK